MAIGYVHEENDSRLEAEREAHFQAYLKSLNLDTTIEIPCTITHDDGKKETSSYVIAESQDGTVFLSFLVGWVM